MLYHVNLAKYCFAKSSEKPPLQCNIYIFFYIHVSITHLLVRSFKLCIKQVNSNPPYIVGSSSRRLHLLLLLQAPSVCCGSLIDMSVSQSVLSILARSARSWKIKRTDESQCTSGHKAERQMNKSDQLSFSSCE